MEETPSLEDVVKSLESLANPSCNKCYGTGRIGWRTVNGERHPIPCRAKNCAMHKYTYLMILQKRAELQAKKGENNAEDSKEVGEAN